METMFQFILMVQRERVVSALQLFVNKNSLPVESSICSAEMHAIGIALDIVSLRAESDMVIFSDSLSVVRSLHVHVTIP